MKVARGRTYFIAILALLWTVGIPITGICGETTHVPTSSVSKTGSFTDAIVESLTGDVYADPSRWREMPLSTFFCEGWNEAWVSPPPGEGGGTAAGLAQCL